MQRNRIFASRDGKVELSPINCHDFRWNSKQNSWWARPSSIFHPFGARIPSEGTRGRYPTRWWNNFRGDIGVVYIYIYISRWRVRRGPRGCVDTRTINAGEAGRGIACTRPISVLMRRWFTRAAATASTAASNSDWLPPLDKRASTDCSSNEEILPYEQLPFRSTCSLWTVFLDVLVWDGSRVK